MPSATEWERSGMQTEGFEPDQIAARNGAKRRRPGPSGRGSNPFPRMPCPPGGACFGTHLGFGHHAARRSVLPSQWLLHFPSTSPGDPTGRARFDPRTGTLKRRAAAPPAMDDLFDRFDPEKAWAAVVAALALAGTLGSLLFPKQVYDQFIWRYYWGPVAADGKGAECAVREGGETEYLYSSTECASASGVLAEPGYTVVSTVSYAVLLILLLAGVYFLIERLDINADVEKLYPLFPWVLFGGALRTVEDASIAILAETGDPALPFPWTAAIISPFIYVTVFVLAVVAIVASVWLERDDRVERWERPFGATGAALFGIAVASLSYLAITTDAVSFKPLVLIVVLLGATAATALAWWVTEEYWPEVNVGTGITGTLVIWGHSIDGFANVISLDWSEEFDLVHDYEPKHVVNSGIQDVTGAIQPGWLNDAIGVTWPFIPVKVVAAVVVLWLFNDEILDESPRYGVLMLLAVLAVGLGPGTRDVHRATFGV